MKPVSKHYYQKRIKELEDQNSQLRDDLYEFRTACSEIYDGLVEVLKAGKGISISWLLGRLKRTWRRT